MDIAYPTCRVDDLMIVLVGLSVPFVLRSKGVHYEILERSCYGKQYPFTIIRLKVLGIMDGEVMTNVDGGKKVMDEIEMR